MKKGLKFAGLAILSVLARTGCTKGGDSTATAGSDKPASTLKVGLICVGDETETYSKAHIDGIKAAAAKLGATVIYKNSVPEGTQVVDACTELKEAGAQLIFTNSYGHQDYACAFAKDNPDLTIVADTGDYAAISGLSNFKNAFTNIYEARYVSGVVAGRKLKELNAAGKIEASSKDAAGNIMIGYVGAYNYAEVVSGYTAFYLGVKEGFEADNVVREVKYTNSWYDHDAENTAAKYLRSKGCVIIGQHADSTGAPEAVEEEHNKGKEVYSVGYNIDRLSKAPTAALTSSTNNWEKYYEYAIGQFKKGESIAVDWAKGYADDAVGITTLGPKVAEGTKAKVDSLVAEIKAGTKHVFDTSKFTITGANKDNFNNAGATLDETGHVTKNRVDFSYKDWTQGGKVVYQGETVDTVKKSGDASYVEESVKRSAPYFALRVDGITETAVDAK